MNLLDLPTDILILLPKYLHNIEDYTSFSSTCTKLRDCLATASPQTILHLAAAQSTTFFRPSPFVLVAATAREVGHWARQSAANEQLLAQRLEDGVSALLDLALVHCNCGLTLARLRELHAMRSGTLRVVEDMIDKCVGEQWKAQPDFWEGGVDDAYTICADASDTLFHLVIYGELFGPDMDAILQQQQQQQDHRRLSVATRLEFIKYVVPDFACHLLRNGVRGSPDMPDDPLRAVKTTGPYVYGTHGRYAEWPNDNNIALTWVLRSSRWRPRWAAVRAAAMGGGGREFVEGFDDGWWYDADEEAAKAAEFEDGGWWRQRMWENVMLCQGLEGLEMLVAVGDGEALERWGPRIRQWRDRIAALNREPATTMVGRQATLEYPYLLGDLRCCASGFVMGT